MDLLNRLLACPYGSKDALDWITAIEEILGPRAAEEAVRRFYVRCFGDEPPGGFGVAPTVWLESQKWVGPVRGKFDKGAQLQWRKIREWREQERMVG